MTVAADTVALNISFWRAFVDGLIDNDKKKDLNTKVIIYLRPKWPKSKTKTAEKPYPLGRTYPYSPY